MQNIEIYGLKSAQGSSSAFAIPIDVDDKVITKSSIVGIGRTTNPVAVSDTSEVRATFDDLGRQITCPYQVRDLIATGYATLTRIAETTILTGAANTYLDVMQITGINATGTATRVDIRASTGGGVIDSFLIPANEMRTKQYNVPLPQDELAASWTAQWSNSAGEISDSPISVVIEAIKNI